ncbi:MAG: hypothetical protein E6593_17560 [Clostridium sp.]|nr:hypothetical protein [Clostridium sp.]
MSNILQTLLATYQQNPAAALSLLPELFQAVEDGRMIELPCKVGDTIYRINRIFGQTSISKEQFYDNNIQFNWFFGKTVFLTREEAEQALKVGDI